MNAQIHCQAGAVAILTGAHHPQGLNTIGACVDKDDREVPQFVNPRPVECSRRMTFSSMRDDRTMKARLNCDVVFLSELVMRLCGWVEPIVDNTENGIHERRLDMLQARAAWRLKTAEMTANANGVTLSGCWLSRMTVGAGM
jgi:hypothetical protein